MKNIWNFQKKWANNETDHLKNEPTMNQNFEINEQINENGTFSIRWTNSEAGTWDQIKKNWTPGTFI